MKRYRLTGKSVPERREWAGHTMGFFDGAGKVVSGLEAWRARGGVDIQWTRARVDGATILALVAPAPFYFYLRPRNGIVDLVMGAQSGSYAGMQVAFEIGDNSTAPAQIFRNVLKKMGDLAGDIVDDDDDDESLELGWAITGFSLLLARNVREWDEHYRFVEKYLIPISARFRGRELTVSSLHELTRESLPASERKRLEALTTHFVA